MKTIVYKAGEAAFKRLPWILMQMNGEAAIVYSASTLYPRSLALMLSSLRLNRQVLLHRVEELSWWGSHTCKRKFSNCSWSSDWYDCRVFPHWAVMLGFGDWRRLWEWRARLRPGSPVAWGEWQWPHSASTCSVGLQGRLMLLSCSYLSPLPEEQEFLCELSK